MMYRWLRCCTLGIQLLSCSHLRIIFLLAFRESGFLDSFAKFLHYRLKVWQGLLTLIPIQSRPAFQVLECRLHNSTEMDVSEYFPETKQSANVPISVNKNESVVNVFIFYSIILYFQNCRKMYFITFLSLVKRYFTSVGSRVSGLNSEILLSPV